MVAFSFLALVVLAANANAVSHENLRGRRSLTGIPEFVLEKFKNDNLLRDDFAPISQEVTGDTIQIGNSHISVADWDLTPVDVFAPGGQYYLDGVKQSLPSANAFRSLADPSILIFKDAQGGLRRASKFDKVTGASISLERIESSRPTFVEMKTDDVDEKKLSKFKYGDVDALSQDEGLRDRLLSQIDGPGRGATRQRSLAGEESCSSGYDVIEVAIDYESQLCGYYGSAAATVTAIQDIVAQTSQMYEQLCVKVTIAELSGYCGGTDPYQAFFEASNGQEFPVCGTTDTTTMLTEYRTYWTANKAGVSRTTAHLFHGYTHSTGTIGCAYIGVLCSNTYGYGVNEITFTSNTALRAVLFSHELGHNAGADHYPTLGQGYIMQPSICSCSLFSDQTMTAMHSEIGSVSCLAHEEGGSLAVTPSPTTAPPTPSPTGTSPTPKPSGVPTPSPTEYCVATKNEACDVDPCCPGMVCDFVVRGKNELYICR